MRWKDAVEEDLKELKEKTSNTALVNWREAANDRGEWRRIQSQFLNLHGL